MTGGEPTAQPEFVRGLLQACRASYIHTAIETCGYAEWEVMQALTELCDVVLLDIKHMSSSTHVLLTGVPNDLILRNAWRIASSGTPLIIRVPVVPGYNDSEDNVRATAVLARQLGAQRLDLLPYHRFGDDKYARLGKINPLGGVTVTAPDDDHMERLGQLVTTEGVKVQIGG